MRIALFHNLPSGGAKRAVCEWTRHLALRHDVSVYTLSTADHDFCDLRPHVDRHVEYDFTAARMFRHPWGRLNQFQRWHQAGRLARLHKALAGAIDDARYDVVFANPCAYTQLPLLLQFIRTPAVSYLHEPVGRARRPVGRASDGGRLTWRARVDRLDPLITLYGRRLDGLQRRSIAATTRLLANSAFTRDGMKEAYGVESSVCHCGVDSETFRILPDVARGSHVLSVGELSPRKGFAFLVEAIGLIPPARRPALRLVCNVVADDERTRVEALAAKLGVHVEVRHGPGTEPLVRKYNRAALCVYAPIKEPFGLVALEAMACGTPLVTVDEGGVRESVVHGETGLLVPREPAAFAEAVTSLLSNPGLAHEYPGNARACVEKYWTWTRSCDELERHLRAVGRTNGTDHHRGRGSEPCDAPGSDEPEEGALSA